MFCAPVLSSGTTMAGPKSFAGSHRAVVVASPPEDEAPVSVAEASPLVTSVAAVASASGELAEDVGPASSPTQALLTAARRPNALAPVSAARRSDLP